MILAEEYYELNLQLFASSEDEGRTEQPTQKRLREEREKGRVAKSSELTSAVILLIGIIFFSFFARRMFSNLIIFTRAVLSDIHSQGISISNYRSFMAKYGMEIIRLVAPIMAVTFFVAFLTEVVQVGFVFSLKPLQPKLSKISFTVEKLMNRVMFSKQVLFNLVKSFFKVFAIGLIAFLIIKSELPNISRTINMNIIDSFSLISWIVFKIILWVAIFIFIISIFDYMFQRHQFMESVKMSIHEVKEERKQYEGDPLIKSRQKERHRELATRRMMQEVPKADVVITNPTHIALAILYDSSYMHAPEIVAKGAGIIAERIKEIARENEVYIQENRQLARELYKRVEIGDPIPQDLFNVVAGIIAFVYRLKRRAV